MITLISALILLVTAEATLSKNHSFLRYLNTSVNPCDDFYEFSCGNFAKYHQRPEYQDLLDLFTLTEDALVQVGHEILSAPKRADDHQALKKLKAAYRACVDVDYSDYLHVPEFQVIEEFGGMPLINSRNDKIDWKKIANLVSTTGVSQIFNFIIKNYNPEEYLLILYPDSEEDIHTIRPEYTKSYDEILTDIFKTTTKKSLFRTSYELDPFDQFLLNISQHIINNSDAYYKSQSEIVKDIKDVRNFLTQLLNGGIVDDDIIPLDPEITIKQLQEWTDIQFGDDINLDWVEYIGEIFKWAGISITEDTPILNLGVDYVYGPLNLIRKTDPKIVKNALLLRSFVYITPDSDATMRQSFETFVSTLGLHVYDRWEYCTRKMLDVVDPAGLSFAVAHEFQRYHYDATKIRKIVELTNELRESSRQILLTLDWIDDESRAHLLKKVENMRVDLAYPDFVNSQQLVDDFYENVQICEWDNYGNARRIRAFRQAYALTEYSEKSDFWKYSTMATNAYTIRANNKILIPMSMLQESFFTGDDAIVDYSRLGTTIAHEMTHNFDRGSLIYNEDGYQGQEYLTNATRTEINTRIQCLIDQYNNYYVPEVNATVDGDHTLDENFADNGGIKKAFLAFQNATKNRKIINTSKNYTVEQLFFISYGTMWCSQEKASWLSNLIQHNVHAPSRIRVLGTLSNFEEFSKAFQCPVGSKMNPKDKCVVW